MESIKSIVKEAIRLALKNTYMPKKEIMENLEEKAVIMCCFQCGYTITPTDNGVCINEGTPHQMYQCNDCHYSEFGVNIMASLLVFNPIK